MNTYGNNITLMDRILIVATTMPVPMEVLTVKKIHGNPYLIVRFPQFENEDMIAEGLTILKQRNPGWSPQYTMTDKSAVELSPIGKVFP